ncbi:nucleotide exchange factor GrpE [Nocardia sp. CDC159]|uniref:Protein GrpE n=1 Tax=Nocardia pulmonis TaxID=2951408 RepID=A0A9X2EAF4_9NOCA|nr:MULTISPECIES: nucleotide exchange factor GrpE [Nocardia]MCM6777299.1 nucleotide exchange factor GrpE [Nocardia pulmonis]MCM6790184.1 nucleotide exchange factor GrpE [Nocardia sp. CDC159]
MTNQSPEQEPVTIVDNRKVDPETGEVRQAAAAEGAAAAPADSAGENQDSAQPASENGSDSLADAISGELAERTADLQRLTAEYTNYRRRVERDRKAAVETAKAAVVTELLGVLDDLDRARAHGDLESGPLKSVADKLSDALRKQGLEEFGVEGEPFDPTLHEAVQHEGDGHDPVIGVVMRKGYRFGDRVLRHALVGVTDGVADLAATPDATNAGTDAGTGEQ